MTVPVVVANTEIESGKTACTVDDITPINLLNLKLTVLGFRFLVNIATIFSPISGLS